MCDSQKDEGFRIGEFMDHERASRDKNRIQTETKSGNGWPRQYLTEDEIVAAVYRRARKRHDRRMQTLAATLLLAGILGLVWLFATQIKP